MLRRKTYACTSGKTWANALLCFAWHFPSCITASQRWDPWERFALSVRQQRDPRRAGSCRQFLPHTSRDCLPSVPCTLPSWDWKALVYTLVVNSHNRQLPQAETQHISRTENAMAQQTQPTHRRKGLKEQMKFTRDLNSLDSNQLYFLAGRKISCVPSPSGWVWLHHCTHQRLLCVSPGETCNQRSDLTSLSL